MSTPTPSISSLEELKATVLRPLCLAALKPIDHVHQGGAAFATVEEAEAYTEDIVDQAAVRLKAREEQLVKERVAAIIPSFNDMNASNADEMQGFRKCALMMQERLAHLTKDNGDSK